jgi:hypothetical protein
VVYIFYGLGGADRVFIGKFRSAAVSALQPAAATPKFTPKITTSIESATLFLPFTPAIPLP